jgi:hypothetical protein
MQNPKPVAQQIRSPARLDETKSVEDASDGNQNFTSDTNDLPPDLEALCRGCTAPDQTSQRGTPSRSETSERIASRLTERIDRRDKTGGQRERNGFENWQAGRVALVRVSPGRS